MWRRLRTSAAISSSELRITMGGSKWEICFAQGDGRGAGPGGATLGRGMATTSEEIPRRRRDTRGQGNFCFGIGLTLLLSRRGRGSSVGDMHGTKSSIGQRRGADRRVLSSPIPGGGQVTRVVGERGGCTVAGGLGSMLLPRRDPPRFKGGELPDRISRGRRDMGRFGGVRTQTGFGSSGNVRLLHQ